MPVFVRRCAVVTLAVLVLAPASSLAQNQGERKKLTDAMGAALDFFGYATAADTDRVLVGSYNSGGKGAAILYERNMGGANAWGVRKRLVAPDGAAGDAFGITVALRGDVAVVGAYFDTVVSTNDGSAYVFERNQGGTDNWGFVKKLTAPDGAMTDYFGDGVCVDGDTIIVTAPYDDDHGDQSGSAYVFERNEGGADNWGFVKKFAPADGAADDQFGWSIKIDADTVAVGAFRDNNPGIDSGSAYIFERNAGGTNNWGQVKKLTPVDSTPGDLFGYGLGLSGDVLIVGAENDDDNGSNSGSAYVFERDAGGAGNWGYIRKLYPSDASPVELFGYAVDVSGNIAVIGSFAGNTPKPASGAAYLFVRNQGGLDQWGQAAKLVASDLDYNDGFGFSAAAAGNICVVSSWMDDDHGDGSGSAYIFDGLVPLGLSGDCNGNGIPDIVDISINHTSNDCNDNGIPDECDIASGASQDADNNGVPDECAGAEPQCPLGDLDGNHVVDIFDFGIFATNFFDSCPGK